MTDGTDDARIAAIAADPRYAALLRTRTVNEWTLSALMFAAFVGFIALIAFDKPFMARPVGDGVMSVGIPMGLGLILFAILLTAVHVRRANRHYDAQLAAILADHAAGGRA
ncbi:MAG: DUF485 domain-containing protein [Sphingobium sp.]|nr:MAG: DUF485 domain-containing protein [Sphingobium sp.]